MKTISTEELKSRVETGDLAIFDVRGDVDYEQGHIPGAKTAPLGSLVFRVARVMNPESEIVVYSGGNEDLSNQAHERLTNLGMQNVMVYTEGLSGWLSAGNDAVESVNAKTHTHGEVEDVRPVVVDREKAYGGAFLDSRKNTESAGG